MKAQVFVCVYLVLIQEDRILLSLRENTGWGDGQWSLVAGHGEVGEPATQAMCREALEEAGITIRPQDLTVAHVMHRRSNRENMDIFMTADKWVGEIQNTEPHKCGGLVFYPWDDLPENTMDYIRVALKAIQEGQFYSEYGF